MVEITSKDYEVGSEDRNKKFIDLNSINLSPLEFPPSVLHGLSKQVFDFFEVDEHRVLAVQRPKFTGVIFPFIGKLLWRKAWVVDKSYLDSLRDKRDIAYINPYQRGAYKPSKLNYSPEKNDGSLLRIVVSMLPLLLIFGFLYANPRVFLIRMLVNESYIFSLVMSILSFLVFYFVLYFWYRLLVSVFYRNIQMSIKNSDTLFVRGAPKKRIIILSFFWLIIFVALLVQSLLFKQSGVYFVLGNIVPLLAIILGYVCIGRVSNDRISKMEVKNE